MYTRLLLLLIILFVSLSPAQDLGAAYQQHVVRDSVFYSYKNAVEKAKQSKDTEAQISAHLNLGDYFFNAEIYTEAVEQYNKALQLATNPNIQKAKVLNHLGRVYSALKNYEKAKIYLNRAEELNTELNNSKGLAATFEILGGCAEKLGDYTESLAFQEKSLKLFTELGDDSGLAKVYENMGSIYEDLEEYDKAHLYFSKAYQLAKNTHTYLHANILNNIGDVYRKTGNYAKGLEYTNKALEMGHLINDPHQIESAHKDLSKTYVFLKDYEKAFIHLNKADELREAMFYSQNFNQLNVLQTLYETKQKEAQIELLTQQNEVNTAQQNLLWLGLAGITLLGVVVVFFMNKKRKASAKLQEYKERTMKAELAQKEVEEKNLHDEIQLKTAALSKYSISLAHKNKLIADVAGTLHNMGGRTRVDLHAKVKELAKEMESALAQEDEWDEFMQFFEDIHPEFIKNISEASDSKLTSTELRLAMLLRLNLSSKEIASVLRVTPDSVRVARYRLRKKLPIGEKQELVNFMLDF